MYVSLTWRCIYRNIYVTYVTSYITSHISWRWCFVEIDIVFGYVKCCDLYVLLIYSTWRVLDHISAQKLSYSLVLALLTICVCISYTIVFPLICLLKKKLYWTPDRNAAVPGLNPAPLQPKANSVSPRVGCHPGLHRLCARLRGAWKGQKIYL
jgi:hypothetical protein